MKIAIITVFSSRNHGSYWQARTLYDYLEELGHEVWFFDTKARDMNEGIIKPMTAEAIKSLLRGRLSKAKLTNSNKKVFINNLSNVKILSDREKLTDFDYLVFGSDEIWNVKRKNNRDFPVFWGVGFDGVKKISYAPSINMATKEDLLECGFDEALKSFSSVSVRDKHSAEVIREIYDKEVVQVLDPTFLFDKAYYKRFKYEKVDGKYIAVYMFDISDEIYRKLREIADMLKMKLVRIGGYDKRFDKCVVSENVFSYFLDADYVVANSFHGTAFSINFNKEFYVFERQYITDNQSTRII